jgi:hypothetical protein
MHSSMSWHKWRARSLTTQFIAMYLFHQAKPMRQQGSLTGSVDAQTCNKISRLEVGYNCLSKAKFHISDKSGRNSFKPLKGKLVNSKLD